MTNAASIWLQTNNRVTSKQYWLFRDWPIDRFILKDLLSSLAFGNFVDCESSVIIVTQSILHCHNHTQLLLIAAIWHICLGVHWSHFYWKLPLVMVVWQCGPQSTSYKIPKWYSIQSIHQRLSSGWCCQNRFGLIGL